MSVGKSPRILAIGECMAELAPAADAGTFHLGFAGDTFNTAWYIARRGGPHSVAYFTAVGSDTLSEQMLAFCRTSGIDTTHVRTLPDRTIGLYLISLDNGERSFSYWRGQSAARCLADDTKALATAIDGADLIYFSGITLAILEPSARTNLLHALQSARAQGKTIAFDPNLRPRLWTDTEVMTSTIMQGAAVSDIALPSFEDEAAWFDDADPAATAQRYAQAGAGTVVVKNGAGAVAFMDSGATRVVEVIPVTNVVDTTAAGDSFNAAILAGLSEGAPLSASIEAACALAGRVVRGKGALVPICD